MCNDSANNMGTIRCVSIQDIWGLDSFCNDVINSYQCPMNPDIEWFLKDKAIEFEKRHWTRTYMVFCDGILGSSVLVGYFSIGLKNIEVSQSASKSLRKKVTGSANIENSPALLLGQIGRNFNEILGTIKAIPGEELVKLALKKLRQVNSLIGGRVVLVECKDIEALRKFYSKEGFTSLGQREDLLQYIKPINSLKGVYH